MAKYVGEGLCRDEAAIVIATPLHWRAVRRRIEATGLSVEKFQNTGQLVVRDAAETLASFVVAGRPDRELFRSVIGSVIDDVQSAGFAKVRAFGEMVDLLRRHDMAATVALEELWNDVLIERGISLLCGYSLDTFDPRIYRGVLQDVCNLHSHLIPVDDYRRLDQAVDRAYAEVFGGGEEVTALRGAFLQHYARPAAMPDAEASLLALREFVPGTADAVLASVRRHYAI